MYQVTTPYLTVTEKWMVVDWAARYAVMSVLLSVGKEKLAASIEDMPELTAATELTLGMEMEQELNNIPLGEPGPLPDSVRERLYEMMNQTWFHDKMAVQLCTYPSPAQRVYSRARYLFWSYLAERASQVNWEERFNNSVKMIEERARFWGWAYATLQTAVVLGSLKPGLSDIPFASRERKSVNNV